MFKKIRRMVSVLNGKARPKALSANQTDCQEKIERSSERRSCATPVLFQDSESPNALPATLFNYSAGGMYVVTESSPRRGSGARVHMVNYSPNESGPGKLKQYHVQVRWVDRVEETPDSRLNGIGVRYCNDLKEFINLFSH